MAQWEQAAFPGTAQGGRMRDLLDALQPYSNDFGRSPLLSVFLLNYLHQGIFSLILALVLIM